MDPENDRQLRLGAIKKNKEKWQRIYQKYKDKYYEFEEPDAQSTPRIEMFNKKDEKSSQTSMVKITSKSTQADESPPILPPRKDVKTMTSKLENFEAKGFSMDSRSQLPEDQSFNTEIAESFSYIPGSSSSKLCSSAGNTRDSAKSLKDTISALLTTDTTNSTVSSILSEKKCRISSTVSFIYITVTNNFKHAF